MSSSVVPFVLGLGAGVLVSKGKNPILTLTPNQVPLNGQVTATFSGFKANKPLTGLAFNPTGGAPTFFQLGTTDQRGELTFTFDASLPSSGSWPIMAWDDELNCAIAILLVT